MALVPSFSYKGRRFYSIEEYLQAPLLGQCNRKDGMGDHDIVSYLMLMRQFCKKVKHEYADTSFINQKKRKGLSDTDDMETSQHEEAPLLPGVQFVDHSKVFIQAFKEEGLPQQRDI